MSNLNKIKTGLTLRSGTWNGNLQEKSLWIKCLEEGYVVHYYLAIEHIKGELKYNLFPNSG